MGVRSGILYHLFPATRSHIKNPCEILTLLCRSIQFIRFVELCSNVICPREQTNEKSLKLHCVRFNVGEII